MSVIQVGLVDTTGELDPELVQAAAAAINIQVTRDLTQFWPITATVRYLPDRSRIPSGVWPVRLVRHLPPGEGGFHLDKHNQPYAEVIGTPDDPGWTIDASHEILEMLVDPYGNRMHSSRGIEVVDGKLRDGTDEFSYLVEACDPCEANNHAYTIQGVAVSDFITPHFYDPEATPGTRYSFTGALSGPRQLLPGGYISFVNQETDEWQQILWVDPHSPPMVRDLGPATGRSLREWIDGAIAKSDQRQHVRRAIRELAPAMLTHLRERHARLEKIARRRAKLYPH
ncbi:MAG TPA: hypothetical protein VME92_04700 [Acetobacteraceae bacterium]|nr:hypothetical protein [Acetobacteraceae bacterium]